ncbi:MAG: helicase HerA-like domain-containing protein [bacterium]
MTTQSKTILLAGDGTTRAEQRLDMSNRHGLIAGATGTGKTVTLQVLAEGFARAGVPVFAVDVKGDLSGISQPGRPHKEIDRRVNLLGLADYKASAHPTLFWDIFGERGHPVRTTISEMGPDILAALLDLNETQTGILYACFAIADDEGLLLLDLKDLRSLLAFMSDNAKDLRGQYGNISSASVGAIQRRLLVLEAQGGERLFGEPAIALKDLMQKDFSGIGVISLLDAERLVRESPKLYAAFLLWLLSELFEELPEAGDLEQPKIVLFFDEAHLLFKDMPKGLLEKVEQVFRLIRSKAVGIYLITQSPLDVPENVLGQMGMKIQHALRAFTPKDQRAIRAVAAGFRNDTGVDVVSTITSLGLGEALVSSLNEEGAPTSVVAGTVPPPQAQIGPIEDATRATAVAESPMAGRYDVEVDRDSAFELLAARTEAAAERAEREAAQEAAEAARQAQEKAAQKAAEQEAKREARKQRTRSGGSRRQSAGEAFVKSTLRSVGRSLGSRLVRGILGSLLK